MKNKSSYAHLQDEKSSAEYLLEKVKEQNESKIPVRVDRNTIIMIKKGSDKKKAIDNFLSKVEKSRNVSNNSIR